MNPKRSEIAIGQKVLYRQQMMLSAPEAKVGTVLHILPDGDFVLKSHDGAKVLKSKADLVGIPFTND